MKDVNKRPRIFLHSLNLSADPKKQTPRKFACIRNGQRHGINATKLKKLQFIFKSDVFAAVDVADAKAPYFRPTSVSVRKNRCYTAICFKKLTELFLFRNHEIPFFFGLFPLYCFCLLFVFYQSLTFFKERSTVSCALAKVLLESWVCTKSFQNLASFVYWHTRRQNIGKVYWTFSKPMHILSFALKNDCL